MRDEQELTVLIKSRFPLVLVETHEKARVLALLEKICNLPADGFSGAEIEQAVVSGLYEAHAAGKQLDTETLQREIAATRPLSATMAEHIQALRDWAQERTVPAN